MTPGRIEHIGTILAPSGSLLLVDMGMLRFWSHDAIPGDAGSDPDIPSRLGCDYAIEGPDAEEAGRRFNRGANPRFLHDVPPDAEEAIQQSFSRCVSEHSLEAQLRRLDAQIPHLTRAQRMLGRGGGVVEFHGHRAIAIPDLRPDRDIQVQGEWMPEDGPFAGRYRRVTLECSPEQAAVRSELLGHVFVAKAQLGFFDLAALGSWSHDQSLDGKADVRIWGADEAQAAAQLDAPRIDTQTGGSFGWQDLPEVQATALVDRLVALRAQGLRVVHDYQPHSHHHQLLRQMWQTPTESGTISLAQARVSAFFTTWGDGAFEVHRELDQDDGLVRLRVELGTDRTVERFQRACDQAETVSRVAIVSRRISNEGAPIRLVYRTQEPRGGFSGFWLWSEDEPEGWGDDEANFVRVRLEDLIRRDPTLGPLLNAPARSAFFREESNVPFESLDDFFDE